MNVPLTIARLSDCASIVMPISMSRTRDCAKSVRSIFSSAAVQHRYSSSSSSSSSYLSAEAAAAVVAATLETVTGAWRTPPAGMQTPPRREQGIQGLPVHQWCAMSTCRDQFKFCHTEMGLWPHGSAPASSSSDRFHIPKRDSASAAMNPFLHVLLSPLRDDASSAAPSSSSRRQPAYSNVLSTRGIDFTCMSLLLMIMMVQ